MRKKGVRLTRRQCSFFRWSGVGSLSSILQRDRILSSFSMGMQKAIEGQAEKGLMLPLPLPPLFCSSSASLECAKKRRDISGEAHLAVSSCSPLQNSTEFRNAGIARVVDRLTFAILHNAERERKRFMKRRVLISIMKPHLAFPIHPSTLRSSPRAGREVFTFNYRRIHHPFDPPLFDVRVRPPLCQFASESRFALAAEKKKEEGGRPTTIQATN